MVHKLGYGNWDELKAAFRTSPLFRFDWFVKSRTTQELARRCDTLIRLVEKENQEYDERERQARKDKKLSRVQSFSFVGFINWISSSLILQFVVIHVSRITVFR